MAMHYDKISDAYSKAASQFVFKRAVESYTLFELLGPVEGKSFLDVACGDGYYARLLRQRGAARVVGVDVSEQMINTARGRSASSTGCTTPPTCRCSAASIGSPPSIS